MDFKAAQQDMRTAYISGSTGVFVSGLMWVLAAIASVHLSLKTSIFVLFFGGMLIHPLSTLLDKALKYSGKHTKDNPLGKLAIESTAILLIGIMIALAVAQIKPEWFFLILLLVIGGRYLLFSTLYGLSLFWVLGGLLVIISVTSYQLKLPIHYAIFAGGFIELIFSGIIYNKHKNING